MSTTESGRAVPAVDAADVDSGDTGMATVPAEVAAPVGLGAHGWLRWGWRQLTSMRTALVLLLIFALAAVPGSVFPQRLQDPVAVNDYLRDNPTWGRVLDRLDMFDVHSAPWFAAIYLLLFISLLGCVLPRSVAHFRSAQTPPPAAPRRLDRLPTHRSDEVLDSSGAELLSRAEGHLRSTRWRVRTGSDAVSPWVSAEKGYARETGNLLFHVSLLALLAAVGYGALLGYSGKVIVREGDGFANTLSQYDSFSPGRLAAGAELPPFSFTLDSFRASYQRTGEQIGAPRDFTAELTVRDTPAAAPRRVTVSVNEPLEVGEAKVFLIGHGYAPKFTVTDKDGSVAFRDSVVFLPQDGQFTSTGVVKAADASPPLGLQGIFLPTTALDAVRGPHSVFPAADDPSVFLSAWSGDLGLDKVPNVYRLDTTNMTKLGLSALRPGQSWTVPTSGQRVTFDGVEQFASFSVAHDPGRVPALIAVVLAIVGLTLSLLVHRRRIFVRVRETLDGITVESAGLTRSEHVTVDDELDRLAGVLTGGQALKIGEAART